MATQTYNIGPSQIAQPGTSGGPAFQLASDKWLAIQTYVNDARGLPTTETEFRNLLGSGAPADLSDFTKLITLYGQMNTGATTWKQTTFPSTVSLASDVYDYGVNKAPIYYNAIIKEANALIANPNDQQAAAALKAILDVLQQYATASQTKAKAASDAIKTFSNEMQGYQTTLQGTDGKGGYFKYYNDEYGSTSADQKNLNDEIASERLALAGDQAQYQHDVTVAATTPTYGWFWPFGTIAAAIVAGIYGHKAVEDLDNIRADQDKINQLAAEIAADANMINALNLANSGINGIVDALDKALPVVEAIEGAWGGIADDLGAIATLIDTEIRNVPPIIMNLGVSDAITSWYNVAQAANAYRQNAYITSAPGTVVSMEQWRVQNLVASPATRAA